MRVAIIGAGPAGLFLGSALARRGHAVTAIDRDPGTRSATAAGTRRGVMQFHHAHAFRQTVADALAREVARRVGRWLRLGAEPIDRRDAGGARGADGPSIDARDLRAGPAPGGMRDARIRAADRPRRRRGRARRPCRRRRRRRHDVRRRPRGRRLRTQRPGHPVARRAGRDRRAVRAGLRRPRLPPASRRRARPDVEPDRLAGRLRRLPVPALPSRARLVLRGDRPRAPTTRRCAASGTRRRSPRAARAIPGLDVWTDPERAEPVTDVLPGGPLLNVYRGQCTEDGDLVLPGLVFVGDSVATTTPASAAASPPRCGSARPC